MRYPGKVSLINKITRKVIQLSLDASIPDEYHDTSIWEVAMIPGWNKEMSYPNPLDPETPDMWRRNRKTGEIEKLTYEDMYSEKWSDNDVRTRLSLNQLFLTEEDCRSFWEQWSSKKAEDFEAKKQKLKLLLKEKENRMKHYET